jgi:RNA dependent RNA polymerase
MWRDLRAVIKQLQVSSFPQSFPAPKGYVFIKQAVVTPSRIIPLPATCIQYSRLLQFWDSTDIIIVRFVKEEETSVNWYDRILGVLNNGFDDILGIHYSFLFAGSSQIRSDAAYFVKTSGDNGIVKRIRDWFVPSSHDYSAAMYASRLALFCTAVHFTGHILPGVSPTIPDVHTIKGVLFPADLVESASGHEFNLTDGSGIISRALMEKLDASTGLDLKSKSAMIVRVGLAKGVFVREPSTDWDIGFR